MTTVVNLRSARKRAARAAEQAKAAERAARHGRSKAERERLEVEASKAAAHLDGHRREPRD